MERFLELHDGEGLETVLAGPCQYRTGKLSDTWNFFQDPFAALGNFYAGEAPSTDNEFLQKMAKEGALLREIISDPMPFLGNYLTGEAAVTDGESLQRAAENGRKEQLAELSPLLC